MGLCKCPKRRVTNLFCYEHRVNVCEHCLISRHYKCVVMSYLQWLQDSDYNSNCSLCNTPLTDEDTIRLVCYDIFHWSCLNKMAAQLPKNTAPAGYQCPMCKGPVFPPANTVSPVASVLKEKLSTVNWARAGLGLPLIEEIQPSQDQESLDSTDYADWSALPDPGSDDSGTRPQSYPSSTGFTPLQDYGTDLNNGGVKEAHSVVNMMPDNESITLTTGSSLASSPRKIYDTIARDTAKPAATQIDFDDDKYRRRPALSWFARWFKNASGSRKRPLSRFQRFTVILLLGALGFLTLLVVMSKLGRAAVENDPNWDVLQNPHIQVGAD
ncbi:zinc finger protein-like 1 [Carcharodon carcharias]|uniref:zinc finger protein-like 1 n=1 Tax=Carcharodon carcharias TaxID=13397 RepID=UPI001B7EA7D8|nr:zinc finger protein-like 1 [Carcharodon carcharias]